MSRYDYECKTHGMFEATQSIKDPPLESCPKCVEENILEHHCKSCNSILKDELKCCESKDIELRHPKPKRLISLSSFSLKGGGWADSGYK